MEQRPIAVRSRCSSKRGNSIKFGVKPGLLRVARTYGESPEVVLVNDTGFPVEFRFPDTLMLDPKNGNKPVVNPVKLTPKGTGSDTRELDVNDQYGGGNTTAEYEACVFLPFGVCIEAVGGSRPEVEIKP